MSILDRLLHKEKAEKIGNEPKGSGNKRIVEIMALGQKPKKIEVGENETVSDALAKADIHSDKVMADGKPIDLSEKIGTTKILNAIPKVKGG